MVHQVMDPVLSLQKLRPPTAGTQVQCRLKMRLGSHELLWCRPVATALIRPLAWEPPYAAGVAQEMEKKQKKKKKKLQHNSKEKDVKTYLV